MDKKQFTDKVQNPTTFSSQERGWLHSMVDKYPFSSPVSVMAMLADKAFQFDTPIETRKAALAMCDDRRLENMLADAKAFVEEHPADILSEINTFQEVSFKTAPKSVILSNFLKIDNANSLESDSMSEKDEVFNDKKSLAPNESLYTETLAIILEKQGKLDKALDVYVNLLAHNPEKSSTFAPRIEKLKAQLNANSK